MKRSIMSKIAASVIAVALLQAAAAIAAPVAGTFDSRDEGSTIIAAIPWEEGALVSSFWEYSFPEWMGLFTAYGYTSATQWYIEAWDPELNGGYMGYVQFNSFGDAPWFGDDPALVGGYEGQITDWAVAMDYTYDEFDAIVNLNLVLTGTALLDQKHMMPWYDWIYEDMDAVQVDFEMGFSGIPDEGYLGGTPDYVVVSVPEPATMTLLGLGTVALISRRRNRRTV